MAEEEKEESIASPQEESVDEEQTSENQTEEQSEEAEKPDQSKEVETLRAQKEHWRSKARELQGKLNQPKPEESKDSGSEEPKEDSGSEEWKSRVEFLLTNRDVTEEEYDHLAAAALRDSGKVDIETLREAKKNEAEYLSFLKKKAENKRKSPGSTAAGQAPKQEKSAKEIADMSSEEFQEYEAKMMAGGGTGI